MADKILIYKLADIPTEVTNQTEDLLLLKTVISDACKTSSNSVEINQFGMFSVENKSQILRSTQKNLSTEDKAKEKLKNILKF